MSTQLTLKDYFKKIEPKFIALTNKETFSKECSFALQHFGKNDYLNKSTVESKLQAVMNVAQCGLTLNPVLKLAWLVPRSVKKNGNYIIECHLEPSYQGLVKLITDTGSVKNVTAHVVYESDEFEVSLGTDENVIHKPKFQSKTIEYVYAIAVLNDGRKQIEVMTAEQVNEIRDKSESYKSFKAGKASSAIWNDHYGEMARKTVVKRLVKYLPKTDMWEKLGNAIELDNSDYSATDNQKDYIDNLLNSVNLPQEEIDDITRELSYMNAERASEVIEHLLNNQVDAITSGVSYGQTEIKDKLIKEV